MKVFLLLDASGSMEKNWDEMLGAINEYVNGLDKEVEISLSTFDSSALLNYKTIRNVKAKDWVSLTRQDAVPGAMTPLVDASVLTLSAMLHYGGERSVFVLITDGVENSSRMFKKSNVDDLLVQVKLKGYQVLFMGANFDKVGAMAKDYNINPNQWADVKPGLYRSTFSGLASASMSYNSTGEAMSFANVIASTSLNSNNNQKVV